jgi:hypothetical protein
MDGCRGHTRAGDEIGDGEGFHVDGSHLAIESGIVDPVGEERE